jgi:hypothetical protein
VSTIGEYLGQIVKLGTTSEKKAKHYSTELVAIGRARCHFSGYRCLLDLEIGFLTEILINF